MPSKKRANKYPNDDEKFTWSMYVENFVHNVPARGIRSEITRIYIKRIKTKWDQMIRI